ncbi:hypothetical protein BKH32_12545 [Actinomyces oris]|uniref:Uncharacterized protein n=1 Tax=Actinomyces oris TaxID=544580 RepID=A0A1Q8HX08_9ACTO|nr:hypothetical protein BKH32_12545 [Actinomyces oris]
MDRVIELDSEAVGFVVSEQWTMMTDADRQLEAFLTHLLDGPGGSAWETLLTPSPEPRSAPTTPGCARSHRRERRPFGLTSSETGG